MNYYEILGIGKNASTLEIKAAYRREAMKWHPDRHQGSKEKSDATIKFKIIAEAYRTLSNSQLRAAYDENIYKNSNEQFSENSSSSDDKGDKKDDATTIFNEQMLDLASELAAQGFDVGKIYNTLISLGCPTAIARAAAAFVFKKHSPQENDSDTQPKNESNQNKREEFFKALIGEKNQKFYLTKFLEFDKKSPSIQITWNFWAALFNVFWMFYRKMWLGGLLYLVFYYMALLIIAGSIFTVTESFEKAFNLASGIVLVPFFVFTGLFANWYYYRYCKLKIQRIDSKNIRYIDKIKILTKSGGTSNIIIAALVLISLTGIFAAIALPAYQNYSKKAREAETRMHQSKSGEYDTQSRQTIESQKQNELLRAEYLKELAIIESRHPELNPTSSGYMPKNEEWVLKRLQYYKDQNLTPVNALKLAISDYEAALRD